MRLLLAVDDLADDLPAADAAAAIARGLAAAGLEPPDVLPLDAPVDLPAADARMRAAFSLVIVEAVLDRGTLEARTTGELAVRARQAGVPCHAIAGAVRLDPFDGRILDLQHVLEAPDAAALERAGRELGARLLAEVQPG
jgi:glycerate kinase